MSDDVIRMQQEAANRVARMQEQSRRLVADHPPALYGGRRESAPQAAAPSQEERRTAASLEQRRRETEQAKSPLLRPKAGKRTRGWRGSSAEIRSSFSCSCWRCCWSKTAPISN